MIRCASGNSSAGSIQGWSANIVLKDVESIVLKDGENIVLKDGENDSCVNY